MGTLRKACVLGWLLALVFLAPQHAQTATTAPADSTATAAKVAPTGQAPDEATKKITELVHAGKYSEAQQLTTGLLVVYPNDQRLIKAKTLIEKLLAPAGPANASTANSQPSQPAANANAEQLTGMDKVAASSHPKSSAGPTTAILHLYRLSHMGGAFAQYDIEIDGRQVAKIANAQSVRMDLPPGKHNINATYRAVKSDRPLYNMEMEAGKEYWIRVDLAAGFIEHMRLALVPEAEARQESGKLKEAANGDLPGK